MTDTKPKRKGVNGKAKGNGFESTIAKLFSETFAPLVFKRTQSSGAIVGGFNSRFVTDYSSEMLTAFIGDIFPANEADVRRTEGWRFIRTLECKFYKEADTFSALFKNPQIGPWFEQAAEDAAKLPGSLPTLIFKFNRTPIFYAVDVADTRPGIISSSMILKYNITYNGVPKTREIFIGLLDDALQDLTWWKQNDQPKTSKENS